MANGITIQLTVDDKGSLVIDRFATTGASKIQKFAQQTSRDLDAMQQSSTASMLAMTASVTAAGTTLFYTTKNLITAYADQERSENNLAKSMANAGQLTKDRYLAYRDYIDQLSKSSVYSKAEITSQAALLQSYGMTEKQLRRSLSASIDLASGMGRDLPSAALVVGKAFAGTTASLGKWGIKVDESLSPAEKFASVLEQINERFGGRAASEMNTYAGQLNQFEKSITSLEKAIGGALIPAISPMLKMISDWITANQALITQDVAGWIRETTKEVKDYLPVMKEMKGIYDAVPSGGIIAAILGYKVAGPVGAAWGATLATILAGIKNMKNEAEQGHGQTVVSALAAAYGGIGGWDYVYPDVSGAQVKPQVNISMLDPQIKLLGQYATAMNVATLSTTAMKQASQDTGKELVTEYWNLYPNLKGFHLYGDEADRSATILERLNSILKNAQRALDTQGMSDYQKKMYEINQQYGEEKLKLDVLLKARDGNRISLEQYTHALDILEAGKEGADIQATTDALKEQHKVADDLTQKLKYATATTNMTAEQTAIYDVNKAWDEQAKKIQEVYDKTKGLQGAEDWYAQQQQKIEAGRAADVHHKMLEDQQKADKEYFDSLQSFFDGSLSQIGDKSASLLDMIGQKFKNLAATIASNMLAQMTMSLTGGSQGFLAQLLGATGLIKTPGSAGGFNLSSLLSNGGSLYSGYNLLRGAGLLGSGGSVLLDTGYSGATYMGGSPLMSAGVSTSGLSSLASSLGPIAAAAAIAYLGYTGIKSFFNAPSYANTQQSLGLAMHDVYDTIPGGYNIARGLNDATSWIPAPLQVLNPFSAFGLNTYAFEGYDELIKKQRLAANYNRGLGRAANADISNMTLSQYIAGGSSLAGEGASAATELGGLGSDVGKELQQIAAIATGYQKTVQTFGESSGAAVIAFARVQAEMQDLTGKQFTWSEKGAQYAAQWLQIAEKTKTLQIKAVTQDLTNGVGDFVLNIEKLRALGTSDTDLNNIINTEGLKFLTTDTLPALYGELTQVREEYKKAAAAVDEYGTADAQAAIKQKIELSDMQLTESQLQTLKYGQVNTDLIALYTALGWTNVSLTLVTRSTDTAKTAWAAFKDATDAETKSLKALADQYSDVDPDNIPKDLKQVYGQLVAITAELGMVAQAGEDISNLPQVFKDMGVAIKGDNITGFTAQLLELANTLTYVGGALEQAGAKNAGKGLLGLGTVGAELYAALALIIAIQKGWQGFMQNYVGNTDNFARVDAWLTKLHNHMPKLADAWRKAWGLDGSDITGTEKDYSKMSLSDAIAFGQTYTQNNPYVQKHQLEEQSSAAISALQAQIKDYEKGGVTKYEESEIAAINQMIKAITDGASTAADNIMKAFTKSYDDTIDAISKYQTGLVTSKYNVFVDPAQMTQNYASQYQQDLATLNSSTSDTIGTNWSNLQSSANSYLDYALQTYGPTKTYQDIYTQIQAMLSAEKTKVGDMKTAYLSKYEKDSIAYTQQVADNTAETTTAVKNMSSMLKELLENLPKKTGTAVAAAMTNKR